MGIPAIQPYSMPDLRGLPPSVAGWQPDPRRAALLVHDMQNYFVDFFPAGAEPVVTLLHNVARLRDGANEAEVPVLYSVQPGRMTPAERGLLLDVWGAGMTDDPRSRAIAAAVAPMPGPRPAHQIVRKRRYSAFHGTRLREVLRELGRDQLIVCGVYAHVGCLMTVADAFCDDIESFLVSDAIADFSLAEHRMALEYAAQRCAVTVSTDGLLAALRPPPVARATAA